MLTIPEYNQIIHDWIVLLTGLSGKNVRPRKYRYGFTLTLPNGKPIAFDSVIASFYIGFNGTNGAIEYDNNISAQTLRTASVSVMFVGEEADAYASQFQALCKTDASRAYLKQNGFAIQGKPTTKQVDKEYAKKWFYRREVALTLNEVLEFEVPNIAVYENISAVPININNK